MRVLFIHQWFPSNNEEGSGRAYDFAKQLVTDGHQVTIVAGQFSFLPDASKRRRGWRLVEQEQHPEGFTVLRGWAAPGYHAGYARRAVTLGTFMATALYSIVRSGRHDVMVAASPPLTVAMIGGVAARLTGTPLMLEIRDLWTQAAAALGVVRDGRLFRLVRRWERRLQRQARAIVVNSPGFKPHLVRDGVPDHCIRLVPNGVDTALFHPGADGASVRRSLGLENKFVVIYAGSLGLANDIPTIIEAAAQLKDEPRVHFLLVGDGNRRREAESDSNRRGLDNVHFIGAVPKQDVPRYLCAADVGLCTLKDIELFRTVYPNKVFDAMACALPVVLLVDGVIREVVERADAGVFVTPGDARGLAAAVRRLQADPGTRRRMGQNGRSTVKRDFDRWACARLMTQTIEESAAVSDAVRPSPELSSR